MILNANSMHIPLKDKSVQMCCTSPPYWSLRDYGLQPNSWPEIKYVPMPGIPELTVEQMTCCLGLEPDPWSFVGHMVFIFREVWRVLRDDGTVFCNIGDSYLGSWGAMSHDLNGKAKRTGSRERPATSFISKSNNHSSRRQKGTGQRDGIIVNRPTPSKSKRMPRGSGRWGGGNVPACEGLKPKDMAMIPARLALALQADGWYLRSDIIWHKPSCMPGSQTDRPTTSHEYIWLLSKKARYFYDAESIKEPTTGNAHHRGNGVNPKAVGKNSRIHVSRNYNGSAPQIRNNDSFSAAVNGLTSKRQARTVWTIASEPLRDEHYAAYPQKLAAKCIKAGTSEVGACSRCGAPWERVIEKEFHQTGSNRSNITGQNNMQGWEKIPRGNTDTKTIAWHMTCKCDYSTPVPCIVLDPFGGAATTEFTARKLGRRAISLELKLDYCLMGKKRIYKPQNDLFIGVTQ